ncbi:hypothetical protein EV426DRAFT_704708 [Tirmania nivea]|nr:hypothetical protein EV426DRAFT_704708 [Tirmania nivea]
MEGFTNCHCTTFSVVPVEGTLVLWALILLILVVNYEEVAQNTFAIGNLLKLGHLPAYICNTASYITTLLAQLKGAVYHLVVQVDPRHLRHYVYRGAISNNYTYYNIVVRRRSRASRSMAGRSDCVKRSVRKRQATVIKGTITRKLPLPTQNLQKRITDIQGCEASGPQFTPPTLCTSCIAVPVPTPEQDSSDIWLELAEIQASTPVSKKIEGISVSSTALEKENAVVEKSRGKLGQATNIEVGSVNCSAAPPANKCNTSTPLNPVETRLKLIKQQNEEKCTPTEACVRKTRLAGATGNTTISGNDRKAPSNSTAAGPVEFPVIYPWDKLTNTKMMVMRRAFEDVHIRADSFKSKDKWAPKTRLPGSVNVRDFDYRTEAARKYDARRAALLEENSAGSAQAA